MKKIDLTHHSVLTKVALISGVILLGCGVTIGVLVAVKNINNTPDVQTVPATQTKTVPQPDAIIKQYTESTKITDRTSVYSKRLENVTNTSMSYQQPGKNFGITLNSFDHVQYDRIDKTIVDNAASVKSSTSTFLTDLGMTAGEQIVVAGHETTTYISKESICQTSSAPMTQTNPANYGLSCISNGMIMSEYTTIDTLLGLYATAGGNKDDLKHVTKTTISEGNKTLSTLDATQTGNTKVTTLIFASVDETWKFIGERDKPSVDVIDSFDISPELQAAISNPKYNGFLAKYIQ